MNESVSINLKQKPLGTLSFKGYTHTDIIKLRFHGNTLFSRPLEPAFHIVLNFSQKKKNKTRSSSLPNTFICLPDKASEASLRNVKNECQ